MKLKYVGLLMLLSTAVGAGITRVYFTKTVEVEKLKETTRTIERIVTTPDGTRTEERIIDEKKEEKKVVEKAPKAPDWFVGVGGNGRVYSGFVNRRILGPVYVGASVDTQGTALLNVGVEF